MAYTASTTDDETLLRKLKKQFRADREYSAEWRKQAKEDFDFVAGEQWSEDDKAHLKSLMRPIITMNRTITVINAVSGQEMGNKQEVRYVGREPGDVKPNELLTEGARWFRDQAEADDEDSQAFLHTTICGMGWTDTTLDYTEEEDGAPKENAIDPLKMFWDKNARKHNLIDRKRQWYVEPMSIRDAKERFPEADVTELDAAWARPEGDEGEVKDQDRERLYEDEGARGDIEVDEDKNVTIVHCEYLENEKYYRVVSPWTGETEELEPSQYRIYAKRAKEMGFPVHSTQLTRRVVRQCFIGRKILDKGDGLGGPHFRFQCITGFQDHNKGTFFGLVRQMKDPQRWANKWLSQALDILNSQAKGGIIIEEDLIAEGGHRDFEKNYSRADKPLYVPPGSLGQYPKIIPKPQSQFPAGFFQLMEFAVSSIRDVVGVSIEMLGMREADQPASLEAQRKQAGMMILQPLFKNLKRYRHEHGKLMLYIIQTYLADGRLVRIVGQEGEQYVPLMKQADIKYDIIVDDMPTSPNQKEMIWAMIGEKFFELPPNIQMALMDYLPFPSTVTEKIKQAAEGEQQGPMAELQQQMAQLQAALAQANVGLTQAKTSLTEAQTAKTAQEAQQPPPDPQQEIVVDFAKLRGQQQLQREKQEGDAELAREKLLGEFTLKAADQAFSQEIRERESASGMAIASQQARNQADIARQRAAQRPANGRP